MFDLEQKKGGKLTEEDKQVLKLLRGSAKKIEDSVKNSANDELGSSVGFTEMRELYHNCETLVNKFYKKYDRDFWDPAGYDFNTESQINRHVVNTGIGILRLDLEQGYSRRVATIDLMSAMLHDVGKFSFEPIVNSGKKLSNNDYSEMEKHPMEGYFITQKALDQMVGSELLSKKEKKEIEYSILHHQQRYDGSGYPHKLQGDKIPYNAQRLQGVDAVEAMTTFRGYNTPKTSKEAANELHKNAWIQFSPVVVEEMTNKECDVEEVLVNIEKQAVDSRNIMMRPAEEKYTQEVCH